MDCSPPGSSVHGIFQAGILQWVAISSSRVTAQPWDPNDICVSCVAGEFSTAGSLEKRITHTNAKKQYFWNFTGGPVVKNLPANAGDMGSIPGQGRFYKSQDY